MRGSRVQSGFGELGSPGGLFSLLPGRVNDVGLRPHVSTVNFCCRTTHLPATHIVLNSHLAEQFNPTPFNRIQLHAPKMITYTLLIIR